jgi:L-alanine-DL-glutamate epimerase-like enolase superfamily enzyme
VRNIAIQSLTGPIRLSAVVERWQFKKPFRITGYEWTESEVVVVEARSGTCCGRGEALGVYYHNDTPERAVQQIEELAASLYAGETVDELVSALPPGGARNALDCALWDLRAKLQRRPVWQLLGLDEPKPLRTTFTVGADTPENMAQTALSYAKASALKLKLTGSDDAQRVRAVRRTRPDVWLGVDANQGFTRESLERLIPVLQECSVELIEQPFPIGREDEFDGFSSPIPIAADESVQDSSDLPKVAGRCDVVNIKLDKCGGLTEGFTLLHEIRKFGMRPMVGCMGGTSLSMAPGFLLGQQCDVVDLDGPILFSHDRERAARYDDEGRIFCSEDVWGGVQ